MAHDRCPELPFLDPRIFRKCSRVEHDGAARRCWKHQAQTGSIGGVLPPACEVTSGLRRHSPRARPNAARAAYWGYPTTHAIPGDLSINLAALAASLQTRVTSRPEAAERWAGYTQSVRAKGIEEAHQLSSQATDFVAVPDLFSALHDTLPDDAICVDEITSQVPQMIQFLYARKPFEQYRGWAGALGIGLGTALGVKLARPEEVVVCIIGDGAWHYNPVSAALGFAQEYGVPLLIVLCNKCREGHQVSSSYSRHRRWLIQICRTCAGCPLARI